MSSNEFTRSLSAAARQPSLTSERIDAFFLRRLAIHVAAAARQAAREVDRPSHGVAPITHDMPCTIIFPRLASGAPNMWHLHMAYTQALIHVY